jgi:hypothetical protein
MGRIVEASAVVHAVRPYFTLNGVRVNTSRPAYVANEGSSEHYQWVPLIVSAAEGGLTLPESGPLTLVFGRNREKWVLFDWTAMPLNGGFTLLTFKRVSYEDNHAGNGSTRTGNAAAGAE